jgi:hypothetical protein
VVQLTNLFGPRRLRSVATLLAVVVVSVPGRANAQPPSTTAEPRVVLFTASGGIAKGSYQGGVDWTITEFLRRIRNPRFKQRLGLQRDYVLGTATGASAGNIDALFAAIHYCTERQAGGPSEPGVPIPVEESLFWKAWVTTGTMQLLPEDVNGRTPEPAALDRHFFEQVYLPAVEQALAKAEPLPGCTVPVGLTLTRIEPVEVRLVENSPATAAVQRFATVFNVRPAAAGGPGAAAWARWRSSNRTPMDEFERPMSSTR